MSNIELEEAGVPHDVANPTNTGLKRPPSEEPEQNNKRQRTSPGKQSPEVSKQSVDGDDRNGSFKEEVSKELAKPVEEDVRTSREGRRKSAAIDEKQRSKRLFGSLLGTLGQGGDRTSKRRQEIEERRKAEVQRQDDARAEDRQRMLERLTERRKEEQWRVDEDNMRLRHQNMLHAANFLRTTTEPIIYYRPWDIRPVEAKQIEEQITSTDDQIDIEIAEFEVRRRRNGSTKQAASSTEDNTTETASAHSPGEDKALTTKHSPQRIRSDPIAQVESVSVDKSAEPPIESASEAIDGSETPPAAQHAQEKEVEAVKDTHEHDEEHMVEGDEDTVIY